MDDDIVWAPQTPPAPSPTKPDDHSDIVWAPTNGPEQPAASELSKFLTTANPETTKFYMNQGTQPVRRDAEGNLNYTAAPPEVQNQLGVDGRTLPFDQSKYISGYDPDTNKLTAYERSPEMNTEQPGVAGRIEDSLTGLGQIMAPGLVTGPAAVARGASSYASQGLKAIEDVSPKIVPTLGMVGGKFGEFIENALSKIPFARGAVTSAKARSAASIGTVAAEKSATPIDTGLGELSGDQIFGLVKGNKLDQAASLSKAPDAFAPGTDLIDSLRPAVTFANQAQTEKVKGAVDTTQALFNDITSAKSDSAVTNAATSFSRAFKGLTAPQSEEAAQNILNSIGAGAKDDLAFATKFQDSVQGLPPAVRRALLATKIGQKAQADTTALLSQKSGSDAAIAAHGAQTFGDVLSGASASQKTAIQGSVLSRLGNTFDANGTAHFSPNKLVDDWDSISDKMKAATLDPTTRSNWNNLVNLTRKVVAKPKEQHTAGDAMLGLLIEHGINATAAVGGGAGAYATGKLLTNPRFIRMLNTLHTARTPEDVASRLGDANLLRQLNQQRGASSPPEAPDGGAP